MISLVVWLLREYEEEDFTRRKNGSNIHKRM